MNIAINTLIVLFVIILLIPFYRLIKGPTIFDRLLSISTIGAKTIALILLFGFSAGRLSMFVDIALAYAVLNFISGVAMAEFFRLGETEP